MPFKNLSSKTSLASSLTSLSSKIQTCFAQDTMLTTMMEEVAEVLREFGREGVEAVIKEILRDEERLAQAASVSYLHKNGFYKLLLVDERDFRIRLHIWLPGTVAYETLHSHRWYMASTVIAGKLQSEVWGDSTSTAQSYDDYLYMGKHTEPILLGKAKVERLKQIVSASGEAYTLSPDVLHRVIFNGHELTATLMCRSANVRTWGRNIIINDLIPDAKPRYMGLKDLKQILEHYLAHTAHAS